MVGTRVRAGCMGCGCNLLENFTKNGVHGVHKPGTPGPGFMDTIHFLVSYGVLWCPKWCPYFYTLFTVLETPVKLCTMDTMDTIPRNSLAFVGGVTVEPQ